MKFRNFIFFIASFIWPGAFFVWGSTAPVHGVVGAAQKKDNSSSMETEWSGSFGGVAQSSATVIRDSESWKNLWIQMGGKAPPSVDFSKKMAVCFFLGMRPTGGYAALIEKIVPSRKKIVVYLREQRPPPSGFVIQALTFPFHIRLVDRLDASVVFKRKK